MEQRYCSGEKKGGKKKLIYHTETEARKASYHYEYMHDTELWVYECPTCEKWHLTSKPPRWGRKGRAADSGAGGP